MDQRHKYGWLVEEARRTLEQTTGRPARSIGTAAGEAVSAVEAAVGVEYVTHDGKTDETLNGVRPVAEQPEISQPRERQVDVSPDSFSPEIDEAQFAPDAPLPPVSRSDVGLPEQPENPGAEGPDKYSGEIDQAVVDAGGHPMMARRTDLTHEQKMEFAAARAEKNRPRQPDPPESTHRATEPVAPGQFAGVEDRVTGTSKPGEHDPVHKHKIPEVDPSPSAGRPFYLGMHRPASDPHPFPLGSPPQRDEQAEQGELGDNVASMSESLTTLLEALSMIVVANRDRLDEIYQRIEADAEDFADRSV